MRTILTRLLLLALSVLTPGIAAADSYADALDTFHNAGESAAFFGKSYGYALFPTVGKGGIGIGGAYGEGRVYAGGKHVGNSTLAQVTIGFQLGGQAYSQIIFFQNASAFRTFTSGNFEFSAQASAVAITAAATAEASTGGGATAGASSSRENANTVSAGYRKGMAVFTVAKGGLMYEAAIGGQKFSYSPL